MQTMHAPASAQWTAITLLANALGAAVAVWGIIQHMAWGWLLGLLVAAGAMIAYVISRVVGLPGFASAPWFESIDVLSLLVEAAFVVIAVTVLRKCPFPHGRRTNRLPTAT